MAETECSVVVNGKPLGVPAGCSVRRLLSILGMADRHLAVALNRNVIPRSVYETTEIAGGDRIEILEAVGGG